MTDVIFILSRCNSANPGGYITIGVFDSEEPAKEFVLEYARISQQRYPFAGNPAPQWLDAGVVSWTITGSTPHNPAYLWTIQRHIVRGKE